MESKDWRTESTISNVDHIATNEHYVENVIDVDLTLKARGDNYGDFQSGAETMQLLKEAAMSNPGWANLNRPQKEAVGMILHKIGRIINGNPNHIDSWHDISGYAQLIEKHLNK